MRRAIALLSVPVLLFGGVLLAATPSTAQSSSVDLGGLPAGGTIKIQTGFSGGVGKVTTVLKDQAGADQEPFVQTVANNTCDQLQPSAPPAPPAPPGSPVAITAKTVNSGTALQAPACFRNLGFGVNSGRDGLSVFQEFLNPNTKAGEVLSIGLTDEAVVGDRAVVFLGNISLDIEAVNVGAGEDLLLTSYLGDDPVETRGFDLSTKVVNSPPNYRVDTSLAQAADRIELTALGNTRFQLEGDTNNKQGSTFNLAQITNVVPCDGGTATAGGATLTVNGGAGCTPEPIVFEFNNDGELLLLKEPSDAEYTLKDVPLTKTNSLDPVEVDYDVEGFAVGFLLVRDCMGSTADPALPGDENPLTEAADASEWDGFCEAERRTNLSGGEWTVTVTLFGVNDPKFR